jgi:hypothetical protein
LLGNGAGKFQVANTYIVGIAQGVTSVAVADFNGDGKLDLAVGTGDSTLAELLGNGDGTFQLPITELSCDVERPRIERRLWQDNCGLDKRDLAPLLSSPLITVAYGEGFWGERGKSVLNRRKCFHTCL